MSDTEKERVTFEKWVSDSGREHMLGRCHYLPGGYEDLTVHAWWAAWLGRAQLAAPEGWKLVPCELTPAMRDAWDTAPFSEDLDEEVRAAYRAMIAVAPSP